MITGNPVQHSLWGHFCQLNQEQEVPTTHPYNTAPSKETLEGLEKQAVQGDRICRLTSFLTLAARVALYATPLLAALDLIAALRGKVLPKTLFRLTIAALILPALFDHTRGIFKERIFLLKDNTERAREQLMANICVQQLMRTKGLSPQQAHEERVNEALRFMSFQYEITKNHEPGQLPATKNYIALLKVEKAFIGALKEAPRCTAALRMTTTTHPLSLSDRSELLRKGPNLFRLSEQFIDELQLKVSNTALTHATRQGNEQLKKMQERGECLDEQSSSEPAPVPLNIAMLYPDYPDPIAEEALAEAMRQSPLFSDPAQAK